MPKNELLPKQNKKVTLPFRLFVNKNRFDENQVKTRENSLVKIEILDFRNENFEKYSEKASKKMQ